MNNPIYSHINTVVPTRYTLFHPYTTPLLTFSDSSRPQMHLAATLILATATTPTTTLTPCLRLPENFRATREAHSEHYNSFHTLTTPLTSLWHTAWHTARFLVDPYGVCRTHTEWDSTDANLYSVPLPPIVDYRNVSNIVSPVKDQGDCGSCWAFSAAESIESQMRLNGHMVNVSTQQFVDCVAADAGCGGGWMDDALAYAEKFGVENDTVYPYQGVAQNCQADPAQTSLRPTAYIEVPPSDEALQRALVTVGPVSIALDATDNFQSYDPTKTPIFNDPTCDPTMPDHALLLVGYNNVEKYWIVKNSWNTDWGMNGYIYLNSTLPNVCGISGFAVVPYVEPETLGEEMGRIQGHVDSWGVGYWKMGVAEEETETETETDVAANAEKDDLVVLELLL